MHRDYPDVFVYLSLVITHDIRVSNVAQVLLLQEWDVAHMHLMRANNSNFSLCNRKVLQNISSEIYGISFPLWESTADSPKTTQTTVTFFAAFQFPSQQTKIANKLGRLIYLSFRTDLNTGNVINRLKFMSLEKRPPTAINNRFSWIFSSALISISRRLCVLRTLYWLWIIELLYDHIRVKMLLWFQVRDTVTNNAHEFDEVMWLFLVSICIMDFR